MEKPSRYIDHELNARHKGFDGAAARFCLAFPDVYEVGISHLGLKILYTIINDLPFAMADRAYLPWLDALELMRREGPALHALESKQPVRAFDAVGVTLQSELTFTNVLELLDLAGIPVHSQDRADADPVILAGGPCASNPLPLSPFIDAFLIGEGEEAIEEIAQVIRDWKAIRDTGSRRIDVLNNLAKIPGVYVPAVHDIRRKSDPHFKIKIRKYGGFSAGSKIHQPQLMPWQLATHNRYVAEIMRGCTRGCRFCHAGYFYRPVRERNPQDILDNLLKEIAAHGWEEAGLISLSSSDYTCIRPLLEALLKKVDLQKTHVSLPSLRVDSLDDPLVSLLREAGREGLTIAPEAGTQRLRDVINKNITEAEIRQGVRLARQIGWQRIKLYFMLGLPTETGADIQGIIDLIGLIISETGKRFQISVSLSPFVPKPQTPFQWAAQLAPEELLSRALLIKHSFAKYKFVRIRYHTIESSVLEAAISGGDEHTARWIRQAWQLGAKYDGWNEGFDWSLWQQAAAETDYDYLSLTQGRELSQALPWDFVDTGVEKTWLQSEWDKALKGRTSPDCRAGCLDCGVCGEEIKMQYAQADKQFEQAMAALPLPESRSCRGSQARYIRSRHYRLIYAKDGDFRFIGHLDWMRMVFRILGRSGLPVVYTQGFNPHPKVSFGPALAVGVAGENEWLDLHLEGETEPEALLQKLAPLFTQGLQLKAVLPIGSNEKIIPPSTDKIAILIPADRAGLVSARLGEFETRESLEFTKAKKTGERVYDLKRVIVSIALEGRELVLNKLLQSPNIYDLLAALFTLDKEEIFGWNIRRMGFGN